MTVTPLIIFFKTLPYLGHKGGENWPEKVRISPKLRSRWERPFFSDISGPNLRTSSDETALERRDYLCRFGGALPRASRNVPPNGADDREPFQRGLAGVCCGSGLTWRGSKRKRQSLLSQQCPLVSLFASARGQKTHQWTRHASVAGL